MVLTENISDGVHEVLRGRGRPAALVSQHHGGGHGVRPRQQRAQRLHAGCDALRHRAAHYRLVAAHCLHDQTHLA